MSCNSNTNNSDPTSAILRRPKTLFERGMEGDLPDLSRSICLQEIIIFWLSLEILFEWIAPSDRSSTQGNTPLAQRATGTYYTFIRGGGEMCILFSFPHHLFKFVFFNLIRVHVFTTMKKVFFIFIRQISVFGPPFFSWYLARFKINFSHTQDTKF